MVLETVALGIYVVLYSLADNAVAHSSIVVGSDVFDAIMVKS